jgi:hypothetical protein
LSSTLDSITFTGTNFFTTGYNYLAELAGIPADSVVVNSATEIVATWITGIPPTIGVAPVLSFGNLTDAETVVTIEEYPPAEQGSYYYQTYKRGRYYAFGPLAVNNSLSV